MPSSLSEIRVLIVDDNAHMRTIITSILEGIGVRQICECHDGASALTTLRTWPADLAIVDFQMSPVDGVEFTHLVRNSADSANPYLPIIMMTGHAEKHRVFEARDAGVTEFVVKPVTARSVVDRINAVIYKVRPFVKTEDYHGPCRRRRADPNHMGPWRRSTDDHAIADVG